MAVYTETIKLDDQVSKPAAKAGASIESISKSLGNTIPGFDKLTGGLGKVASAFSPTFAMVPKFDGAVSRFRNSAGQFVSASDAQAVASHNAEVAAGAEAEQIGLAAGAMVAAAAAAVALGAAVAVGVVKMMSLAIEASTARDEMISMFDALGEGKQRGDAVFEAIDELGDSIGQTREKLAPLAAGFMRMGITGADAIAELTKAAASAEAIAKGGGEAFTKMFAQANAAAQSGEKLKIPFKKLDSQLRASGLNIGDLATQMGMSESALTSGLKAGTVDAGKFANALKDAATTKGAGPLAKAGLNLSNIWAKAQETFMDMFSGLGPVIEPFLAEVKALFGEFGKGKAANDTLKSGIQKTLGFLFQTATKLVPLMKHFFLDMIIFGLKAYLAVKPLLAWMLGLKSNQTVMTVLSAIVDALKVAFIAVGVAVGVVVVVIGVLWAIMVGVGIVIWALVGAVLGLGKTLADFGASAADALKAWAASATTSASDFIAGLVNGIKNGVGMVVQAAENLGGAAIGALKKKLGIASPSKVAGQLGGFTGEGFAGGIEDAAPSVAAASSGVASAALAPMAAPSAASSGGGGGKAGTTINVNVQIDGAGKSAEQITEEMVSLVFERYALMAGA